MGSALRRVTIRVPSVETSARFYSEALGMSVFYETTVRGDDGSLLGPEGSSVKRFVSMRRGDGYVGMIGLIEYTDFPLSARPFERQQGKTYPVIFVILSPHDELSETSQRVRDNGGTQLPTPDSWLHPGGQVHYGIKVLDPSGVLLEIGKRPSPAVTPLRRVTIPVSGLKMSESVRWYEQVLGMRVFYDQGVVGGAPGLLAETDSPIVHLVSLQQGNETYGMVGFLEVIDPAVDMPPLEKRPGSPYDLIFEFNVDNIDDVLERAVALGSKVVGRGLLSLPNRGPAMAASVLDPNGVLVVLTRWM